MYSDLTALQTQANGDVNSTISDVNTTLTSIASLNQEIAQSQVGTSEANDYIDQRNQLLQTLSGIHEYQLLDGQQQHGDGPHLERQEPRSGKHRLPAHAGSRPADRLHRTWAYRTHPETLSTSPATITGGSLGALITARDTTIPGYISDLNGLAQSITENVNYFSQMGNGGTPDQSKNAGTFFRPSPTGITRTYGPVATKSGFRGQRSAQ